MIENSWNTSIKIAFRKKYVRATSSTVEVVHFGNITNNCLENANRLMKTMVRRLNSIEVVLNNLFLYSERNHVETTSKLTSFLLQI